MAAWRCDLCLTNWPMTTEFKTCPDCQQRCSGMSNAKPLTIDEAKSRKAHALFERQYEKYDADRAGPSPEDVGKAEARELAQRWREIEAVYEQG